MLPSKLNLGEMQALLSGVEGVGNWQVRGTKITSLIPAFYCRR